MAAVAQGVARLIRPDEPARRAPGARPAGPEGEALVLASASPRRAALLAQAGHAFTVRVAAVDETPRPGEAPAACAERLARAKARDVARQLDAGLVLGADTVVSIDGELLGKPDDEQEARAMLQRLAGREHLVVTGVALAQAGSEAIVSGSARATVAFQALDEPALARYLATREWTDKAGGYGLQGAAGAFARLVAGRRDTVVGLPLDLVDDLLRRLREELR